MTEKVSRCKTTDLNKKKIFLRFCLPLMEAPKFSLTKAKISGHLSPLPLKFINGKLFNFGRFSLFPRKPLKDPQRSHRPFKTCHKNCERHPKDFVGGLRETLKPLNLVRGFFFQSYNN